MSFEIRHLSRSMDEQQCHSTSVVDADVLLRNPVTWTAIVVVPQSHANSGCLVAEFLICGAFACPAAHQRSLKPESPAALFELGGHLRQEPGGFGTENRGFVASADDHTIPYLHWWKFFAGFKGDDQRVFRQASGGCQCQRSMEPDFFRARDCSDYMNLGMASLQFDQSRQNRGNSDQIITCSSTNLAIQHVKCREIPDCEPRSFLDDFVRNNLEPAKALKFAPQAGWKHSGLQSKLCFLVEESGGNSTAKTGAQFGWRTRFDDLETRMIHVGGEHQWPDARSAKPDKQVSKTVAVAFELVFAAEGFDLAAHCMFVIRHRRVGHQAAGDREEFTGVHKVGRWSGRVDCRSERLECDTCDQPGIFKRGAFPSPLECRLLRLIRTEKLLSHRISQPQSMRV